MTVPNFQTFQSTVTPFVPQSIQSTMRMLLDSASGAPVGMQSTSSNGPNAIWVPVDLTAAQIASPTQAMLDDLNSTFRLNEAPYTRYVSDGTQLLEATAGPAATVVDVMAYGAKGDWDWNTMTGTNDQAVIQALFDNPPFGRIVFPAGRQFYVGTGLVVPASSSLYLSGEDFSGIAYPPTTSGLVCDPNCDCLLIDSAQGCVVENLTCSSSATVQPTYGAGIKVLAGRRISLNRTLTYNTYESYRWEGTSAGGLGGYMREPYAAKIVRAFIVMRTWAELYISGGGRFGNSADWTVPEAHVSLEGGISGSSASPNSLSIIGVQMQCQLGPVSFGAIR